MLVESATESAGVVDGVVEALAAICTGFRQLVGSRFLHEDNIHRIQMIWGIKRAQSQSKKHIGTSERNRLTISHRMGRIPGQSHRSPSPFPLNSRPVSQPLAPENRIRRQRKKSRTEWLCEILCVLIPDTSDLRRGGQALVAALAANRQRRRPGPPFRPLVVRYDVDLVFRK